MTDSDYAYTWPKVILYGDSITQYSFSPDGCWGSLLADYLQRKCDVINRGFSGYNVRFCRQILPNIITKDVAKETAAIMIFLGANDSNDETSPFHHVPLDEYKEGLTAMVEYLTSMGIAKEKIILITPPAFDETSWQDECVKNGRVSCKNNATTGVYARACAAVAKVMGTQLVDFYTHMMNTPNWESLLKDGLHLSASGSETLFSLLRPVISQITKAIPIKFPA